MHEGCECHFLSLWYNQTKIWGSKYSKSLRFKGRDDWMVRNIPLASAGVTKIFPIQVPIWTIIGPSPVNLLSLCLLNIQKLYVLILLNYFSGIGLGLVDEVANFVKDDSDINFCITCRNMKKGISLKTDLNQKYPTINVILVELNVESIKSVINGCKKIKER